jgi:glucokinase
MKVLAGDIGGTKTKLGIFSSETGAHHSLVQDTFPSGKYDSLEAIVKEFMEGKDADITRASFGVAGPVLEGRAKITNLSWVIKEKSLSQALGGIPVRLLNDLNAIAHAVPLLGPDDLESLNPGEPEEEGAIAVIAPGTGLGEGFLFWDGNRYQPSASEGGHVDYAPTNEEELDLLRYLMERNDHVSYELICSGLGLPNIYAWLKDGDRFSEPEWLRSQLDQADDLTPVIVRAALEESIELAVAALERFVSVLGSEAGNLALKILATGGVYLGGGIPPRILPYLKKDIFLQAFVRKGRFSNLLSKVPVHVIVHPEVALFGAARHGLEVG